MSKILYPSRGKAAIQRESTGGEKTTEHGIIYNEKQKDIFFRGKVHSMGYPKILPNGNVLPTGFNEGDTVVYNMKGINEFRGLDIVDFDYVIGVVGESV